MVLDRGSPSFGRYLTTMESSVVVWPSPALARRAAAADYHVAPTACVKHEERREREAAEADAWVDPGFHIAGGHRTFSKLPFPLPGVADSYGTRTVESNRSITFSDGRSLHNRTDRLAFVMGPVVIEIYALNTSPALERKLLAHLLQRARTTLDQAGSGSPSR